MFYVEHFQIGGFRLKAGSSDPKRVVQNRGGVPKMFYVEHSCPETAKVYSITDHSTDLQTMARRLICQLRTKPISRATTEKEPLSFQEEKLCKTLPTNRKWLILRGLGGRNGCGIRILKLASNFARAGSRLPTSLRIVLRRTIRPKHQTCRR
jgi:hypothetical protein